LKGDIAEAPRKEDETYSFFLFQDVVYVSILLALLFGF
jgi:hypothetical protein